jgi:hypothetical protein
MLFACTDARFCEILMKDPESGYIENCRYFEVSHEPEKRDRFYLQQKALKNYIEELKKFEEKQLGKTLAID